jgi:hypothetical protein
VWLGIDWGFEHDAAIYWFTTSPAGKTYIYRELVINHTGPKALAERIVELSIGPDGKPEKPLEIHLSFDTFAKRTDADPIANQMAEVFKKAGWPWPTEATRDKVGREQLMYEMLKDRGPGHHRARWRDREPGPGLSPAHRHHPHRPPGREEDRADRGLPGQRSPGRRRLRSLWPHPQGADPARAPGQGAHGSQGQAAGRGRAGPSDAHRSVPGAVARNAEGKKEHCGEGAQPMAAAALDTIGWWCLTILALCAALRMIAEITNRPVCPNCKSGHTFESGRVREGRPADGRLGVPELSRNLGDEGMSKVEETKQSKLMEAPLPSTKDLSTALDGPRGMKLCPQCGFGCTNIGCAKCGWVATKVKGKNRWRALVDVFKGYAPGALAKWYRETITPHTARIQIKYLEPWACALNFHKWEEAPALTDKGDYNLACPGRYARCARSACQIFRDKPLLLVDKSYTEIPEFLCLAKRSCPSCMGRGYSKKMMLPNQDPKGKPARCKVPCNCLRIQPAFVERYDAKTAEKDRRKAAQEIA